MKKINLLVISIILLSFLSCKDTTEDYVRSYFTDTQLSSVIKECLNLSVDTANAHLSVPDGFYLYNKEKYRITLPSSASTLISVLTDHDEQELLDTLVLRINRAAEISGDQIKRQFATAISASTFTNPDALLRDTIHAMTTYFQNTKTLSLISALRNHIEQNLNSTRATTAWQEALTIYQQHESQPLSIDLTGSVTQQVIENIMAEMAIEESYIRTDTTHQISNLMRNVFLNYSN